MRVKIFNKRIARESILFQNFPNIALYFDKSSYKSNSYDSTWESTVAQKLEAIHNFNF